MAQSERVCYINHLPNELFAKILDLVPITDVFANMRVSKRWEDMCRHAVRTRKSLIIGNYILLLRCTDSDNVRGWDWHRNKPSQQLDKVRVANESLVPMMKSVSRSDCRVDIMTDIDIGIIILIRNSIEIAFRRTLRNAPSKKRMGTTWSRRRGSFFAQTKDGAP